MADIKNREADVVFSTMGLKGGILVTDTTAITGEFRALKVISDATFTTLTTPNLTKNGTVIAVTGADWGTLSENTVIENKITACTLSSGKVLLYK